MPFEIGQIDFRDLRTRFLDAVLSELYLACGSGESYRFGGECLRDRENPYLLWRPSRLLCCFGNFRSQTDQVFADVLHGLSITD